MNLSLLLTYCYVPRRSVRCLGSGRSVSSPLVPSFFPSLRPTPFDLLGPPLAHSLAFVLRPSLPPRPVGGLVGRPRLGPKSQSSARFRVIRSVIQSQSSGARDQQQPRLQVSRFLTLSPHGETMEYLGPISALGIDADLVSNLSTQQRFQRDIESNCRIE